MFTRRALMVAAVLISSSTVMAQDARLGTYKGTWSGINPGDRPVMYSEIVVVSIAPDGKATGHFNWADAPQWGVKAGTAPIGETNNGRVDGTALTWGFKSKNDNKQHDFKFAWQPDGKLAGGRWVDGAQTGKVTLTKTQ
jgi:hypothetical protein